MKNEPSRALKIVQGVAIAVLLIIGPTASAACFSYVADEILTIRVAACEPVPAYLSRMRETITDRVRHHIVGILKPQQKGLVIEGFITRREIVITDEEERAMPDAISAKKAHRWLFADTDRTCDAVEGSEIQVYKIVQCCDVDPSTELACFFSIGYVEELPSEIAKRPERCAE